MRFLVDANILLDVLMNRQPHVTDSASIWKLCETGQAEGYISSLTFANLIYIMRKEINPKGIEIILDKLSLIFHFADLTSSDLISAAKLQWNDFEDENNFYDIFDSEGNKISYSDASAIGIFHGIG